jgi:hypothetical protein
MKSDLSMLPGSVVVYYDYESHDQVRGVRIMWFCLSSEEDSEIANVKEAPNTSGVVEIDLVYA